MEAIQPLQSSSSSSLHQQIQNHNQYQQQIQPSDSDPTAGELRALDCNLASLCDHVQNEGFHSGAFSDVIVEAMGSTYPLHRLILSRSSYFRNMLYGPWKEAGAPTIVLSIDDANVNSKSIEMALAYLYGHHPKLNDDNAFRVLAAASFLDLQDLCAICTDFIISELWTSNFLAYQVFAEGQDYGIHGERVRNACWGYLCQSGTMELREVLPKLSSQTLHALLTSDELWVPNEEKRFELALYVLLAKAAFSEANQAEIGSMSSEMSERNLSDAHGAHKIESESHRIGVQYNFDGHKASHNILVELADCVVDSHTNAISVPIRQPASSQPMLDSDANRASCTYLDSHIEGPSDENMCYHQNNNNNDDDSNTWIHRDQLTEASSTSGVTYNDWGKCNMQPLWGGRIVGRRQVKNTKGNLGMQDDEYDSFISIFEGGSLLYCNMSFEALLNVRKQLEELGFPCKAVNDGLWLQMLLCQKVQEVAANTCRNCCLTRCACRQSYGCSSKGGAHVGYYRQEHDRNNMNNANMGNIYVDDPQGDGGGAFVPAARLHVRGPIDGLAGIGRGNAYVVNAAWPPTRYVFSRVPFGLGARNGQQQSVANDESEPRVDINGDLSGDGLTALVNLSQGSNIGSRMNAEQSDRINEQDLHGRFSSACGISMQMMEPHENSTSGLEWGNSEDSSILLDTKTPLRDFPPFRFGIEFDEVHRLADGQVKHSPEVFYAGSLWKVSVQAFNDEDPQGRRTLGLFLHRRKSEINDSFRKIHTYVDTREKVTARYQLICPSKREVMVFGSFKQAGTQLPKAPKGWGWRTALLFDELGELLQGGTLRIAAVVQLV